MHRPLTGFLTATAELEANFRRLLHQRGFDNHVFYVKSPSAGYRMSRLVVTFSLDPAQIKYPWSPQEVRTLQHIVDNHWRTKVVPGGAGVPIYRPESTFEQLIEEFCGVENES